MKLGFNNVFNCTAGIANFEASSFYASNRCWTNDDFSKRFSLGCKQFHSPFRNSLRDYYHGAYLRY